MDRDEIRRRLNKPRKPFVYPDGSENITLDVRYDSRSLTTDYEPSGEPLEVFLSDETEIILYVPQGRTFPRVTVTTHA